MSRKATSSNCTSDAWTRALGNSGVYALVLHVRTRFRLPLARVAFPRLPVGWYVYVGSAKRALRARLQRHLLPEKRPHRHIDALTARARVREVWVWPWSPTAECEVNANIQGMPTAEAPFRGFGSSDCACVSHLTVFPEIPSPPFDVHTYLLVWGGSMKMRAQRDNVSAAGRKLLTHATNGRIVQPRARAREKEGP